MTLTPETANLLKDETTRGVFQAVAKPRTIQIRDLRVKFKSDVLERSIKKLTDAKLIKVSEAPIEDFKTLYVTTNGLNLAQALTRRGVGAVLSDIF